MKLKPNEKQFIKSFVLVVTMEYQNGLVLVIIGPGMLQGLSNKPKLYSSFSESPCSFHFILIWQFWLIIIVKENLVWEGIVSVMDTLKKGHGVTQAKYHWILDETEWNLNTYKPNVKYTSFLITAIQKSSYFKAFNMS